MKKQNPTINPVRTLGTFCRRTYFLALLLALLLSGTRAWAQVYPVNVSMQGDALFYGSLATIGNGTAGGFSAGLFFNDDQEKNDRPIYYELSISNPASGAPLTVQSRGHYYQPGSVFLDANDIAKLVREKFSDQATIYNMTYREGLYTIGLRVVDEQTGRQISNQGTFLFTARSLTPPRLYFTDIKLACGRDIAATSATAGLTFDIKWYPVPPISSSTTIVYYVDYIMLPQQAAPSGALFQYNGPDEAEVPNGASSFSVDISGLQATTYIYFRVRAVVKGSDSNPIGDPDGISSEVCWLKFVPFSEAEQTRIVSLAVAGKVQPTSATLAWTTENPVDGMTYTLNYRPEGTTQSPVSIDKIGGNRCTVSNLEKGTKYEFWVESQVQSSAGNPEIRSDMLVLETPATVEMGKCGIEPQTNSDLLKSPLAVLLPGDQVYMDGGFVLLVDEVYEVSSGGAGTFSGKGRVTMALSLLSGYLPNLSVDFDKIFVDTNYEFRGGTISSIYKIGNWMSLADLTALTRGGQIATKLASGQLTPDTIVAGTIASVDALVVETTKMGNGEVTGVTSVSVTYTDGSGAAQTLKIEGADLTPKDTDINALVIKDASDTYYSVDLATGIVSLVGRYSEEASKLLAGLNIYKLGVADASKAVTFSRNQNVWAFDEAKSLYLNSAYYGESYNKVTYLGSSGTIYPTPWQFLPKGGAPQEVLATIPDGYDMAQMKFVTSTGLDITPKAGGGRDLILPLQPASGEELYQVYAFHMNTDGTATYCGAMNVMTRSIKTYKAKLVKLGGSYDLAALRTGLNNIYNPCGIVWELEEDLAFGTDPEYLDALTTILNEGVGPENNDAFFSEYTANQKALNSLYRLYSTGKSTYEDKTVYLFALPSIGSQLGDMPIGKQWGYLFGNVEAKVLAHELGHGKLSLAHTFAHNLNEGATGPNFNLMDYPVGNDLVARQWGSMHDLAMLDPFQDDAAGAAIENLIGYYTIKEDEKQYGFLSAAGKPITIPNVTKVLFNEDGGVLNFVSNGKLYYGVFIKEGQRFLGYISKEHASILDEHNYLRTLEFVQAFEEKKYTGIMNASVGKTILAFAKFNYLNTYWDCVQKYTWVNNFQSLDYIGVALPPFIPDGATMISESGRHCVDFSEVKEGVGFSVFMNLIDIVTESQRPQLIELANYLSETLEDKRFTFYHPDLNDVYIGSNYFNKEILLFLRTNKIYSKALFETAFPVPVAPTVDFDVIFSTSNLWQGIIPTYNINSTDFIKSTIQLKRVIYQYTFDDLKYRKKYIDLGGAIAQGIINGEQDGLAPAMTQQNYYDQYLACFGTESAVFAWTSFAANSSKDVLMAMFAQRLAAEYGSVAIKELVQKMSPEAVKRFLSGAMIEIIGNIIANEILKEEVYSWKDIGVDAVLAGFKEVVQPKLLGGALADCVIGLDISTVEGLIKSQTQEKFWEYVAMGSVQCFVPAAVGVVSGALIKKITQGSFFTNNAYDFFKNKLKIGNTEAGELVYKSLNLDSKFTNPLTRSLYKTVLSMEDGMGAKAMDVLLDANFDVARLSGRNFERLANILRKSGGTNRQTLIELFSQTNDVSRMLIFLDKNVSSVAKYSDVIASIKNNANFSKTITINGKTMNLSSFFETTTEAYEYYHKEALGKHYFAKVENGDGILIVIETVGDVVVSSVQSLLKNVATQRLENEFDVQRDIIITLDNE